MLKNIPTFSALVHSRPDLSTGCQTNNAYIRCENLQTLTNKAKSVNKKVSAKKSNPTEVKTQSQHYPTRTQI